MKTIFAALGVIAAGLVGCAPPVSFADRCVANGYQPGTQLYLNCLDMQQQAALRLISNVQQQNYQQQQLQQQQLQFYQPRPIRPTNCLSNIVGGTVSTFCN